MWWQWPHWLPLAVLAPLGFGVTTPAVSNGDVRKAWRWAVAASVLTTCVTLALVVRVAHEGPFSYAFSGWQPPYGIEFRFDEVGAFAFVVAFLGMLAVVFSGRYAEHALDPCRVPYYYALLLLDIAGLIGFSVTGDMFNMYVFMEIISLSSYALVAVSGERIAEMAAFKYLVLGAVSSLLVLFGIGMIYGITGTLNLADAARLLGSVVALTPVAVAIALIVAGFMVKSALFPLHVWLPDAHAIAPSPVSAILSGLVVKVGLLGTFRFYQVVYRSGAVDLGSLNQLLVWLGAISIVMGAFFAIFQDDIKMMLAYSTISNVGYIVMGIGLASQYAVIGAAVHIFNHAIIKSALFLAAGAIIHQTGYRRLSDLRGVGRGMPLTAAALSVGAVSIVGIPPTAGFLCKWYIALGAFEAGRPAFGFALIFGALFIFVYYIRMLNAFYFQEPVHADVVHAGDPPFSMLVPTWILAGLCLAMGLAGKVPLTFIAPAVGRLLGSAGG
ncbi:monovalent cation/H+ antiporter subunit D family protein [Coriobacteriia bacterium Es71-Z0120]|uniref:complex I subunit 5 family protein n=1 Tax=Parvivirga hydrogeniphila TaxID=2939460 RepID=UPI002260E7BF|nr:monovalent cation/H+ antiporter subunit D family protein [Parvivirga hydrogeniphila]MCL4078655.1 monovalent cation/H+ antiporter subunit D family protein [Parvivirga hydrogeniphila]